MQENIPTLLNTYSKLILAVMNDIDEDPLWRRFYQLQITEYLLSKKDFKFELDEAEKAYSLIVNTWTDLKGYLKAPVFPVNDIDNIFKSVLIEFPFDDLSINDTSNNDELIFGSI